MRKGTYWIYRGNVKWMKGDKVREQDIEWKMEIVRVEHVADYEVAVLKGSPGDLIWYTPGKPRGDHLIVRDGGKYYRLSGSNLNQWQSQLNFDSIFLDLPLGGGECLGRDPGLQRKDLMFCWLVSKPAPVRFQGVKGVSPGKQFAKFELAYRANTDHTIIDFVPGLGITSYVFGHHGTVSVVNLKLVEYHPGTP